MRSIIQDEKACFITGRTEGLHRHHIFFGNNRELSEKYGLWVWLCAELHNMGDFGVHGKYGKQLDLQLKQEAQRRAMDFYRWSTEDFIRIFGRNYI